MKSPTKDKYTIAIVTPGSHGLSPSQATSVEIYTMEAAKKLANDFRVIVIAKQDDIDPQIEEHNGITVVRFPQKKYKEKVIRFLTANPPDLIQMENRPLFSYDLKKHFPAVPVILNMHSITFAARLAEPALSASLKTCDRLIVNSVYMKKLFTRHFPFLREKTEVIYPGTNINIFQRDEKNKERIRQTNEWQGKTILLYIGRLIPQKGVHLLLEACRPVLRRREDLLLFIVGSSKYGKNAETAYTHRLKRCAAEIGNVRFFSYVPHDRISEIYQSADILIFPSVRHEAFGLVNVEAMAAGLPVIASDCGGVPEIVEHGVTGIVYPRGSVAKLREGILALAGNKEKRLVMGMNGRKRVEALFTWERTARGLKKLYHSVLDRESDISPR